MAEPFRIENLSPEQRAAYERMMYGGRVRESLPAQKQEAAPPAVPTAAAPAQPDIPKIKRNVRKMLEQDAPDEDVDAYLQIVGVTADQLRAHKNDLSWSEIPGKALDNLGNSAGNFAQAVVHPFLHPIDTAKAIGNIAYGAGSKIGGALGVEQDPERKAANEAQINAVGEFFANRYGSIEDFKRTLAEDPVGVAADLSVVLTGGGAMGARAPGIVGRAAQTVSKVGSAIDPLANVGRVARGTGKAASAALGMTTGVGPAPIQAAFNAGRKGSKTFTENMRGQAPIEDTLSMAQNAMGKIRDDRRAAYEAGMANTNASFKTLDLRPVAKSIEQAARMVNLSGNKRTFSRSAEAMETVRQMAAKFEEFNALDDATKLTPKGVDALKQAIGEIRMATKQGTLSRTVANSVFNAVKAQIVKQVPDYANAMRGYSQASDQLDDLTKTFSLGENTAKDTAIRKLTSVMRNNVNTNYGRRAQLMDVLATKEPELPFAVAGQALNSMTPRGLSQIPATMSGIASLANPAMVPALAAASPRLVGEAANATGKAVGVVDALAKALGVDVQTAQRILLGSYAVNQGSQPTLIGSQTGDYPTP